MCRPPCSAITGNAEPQQGKARATIWTAHGVVFRPLPSCFTTFDRRSGTGGAPGLTQEVLRPIAVQAPGDPLAPAKGSNALPASQSGEHDPDFLFARNVLARLAPDALDQPVGGFLRCPRLVFRPRSLNASTNQNPLFRKPSKLSDECRLQAACYERLYPSLPDTAA